MGTECNTESLVFHPRGRRDVAAHFDGGRITSDAGGLKLLKIGVQIRMTVRKWMRLAESCPYQTIFQQVMPN